MGEGDAEVEAPAFMPGEDVHRIDIWDRVCLVASDVHAGSLLLLK